MFNNFQSSTSGMDSFVDSVADWILDVVLWIYQSFVNVICSVFFAALAYFTEIHGSLHVMWAAMALDLLFGIGASLIKHKQKFSMEKFFVAVGRGLSLTILVGLIYAIDRENSQNIAPIYQIASWFFSFFYAISIGQNMYALFGGWIFKAFGIFLRNQMKEKTGVDINEIEKEA